MSDESTHEKALGGKLLASVSRSFYLTLKALPRVVREPISLAYLLARAADTIADTTQVPADVRLQSLARFRDLILGPPDENEERSLGIFLQGRFCPHQTDEAEARLMGHVRDALAWLRTVGPSQLTAIRGVLEHIIRGQMLDIERYPGDGRLRALATGTELDDYIWLVAGCVGEFWTKLCLSDLPSAFVPGTTPDDLIDSGIRYGKGLQLINILRDLPKDIDAGRCYLPEEELKKLSRNLVEVRLSPLVLDPLRATWLAVCEEHLAHGLRYIQSISDAKLRYATALPLLIGVRTAALLRNSRWEHLAAGIKVSRLEIAKLLADTAIACRDSTKIKRLYEKLSGNPAM